VSRRRARLGRAGERRAARYLKGQGLRLIERNWRCAVGELDLVMRDADLLVIVEVRSARGRFAGGPSYTVGPDKQRRLTRLAQLWIQGARWRPTAVRFDVMAMRPLGWLRWDIHWIQDAFQTPEA